MCDGKAHKSHVLPVYLGVMPFAGGTDTLRIDWGHLAGTELYLNTAQEIFTAIRNRRAVRIVGAMLTSTDPLLPIGYVLMTIAETGVPLVDSTLLTTQVVTPIRSRELSAPGGIAVTIVSTSGAVMLLVEVEEPC